MTDYVDYPDSCYSVYCAACPEVQWVSFGDLPGPCPGCGVIPPGGAADPWAE
jgi:hypothetical protein